MKFFRHFRGQHRSTWIKSFKNPSFPVKSMLDTISAYSEEHVSGNLEEENRPTKKKRVHDKLKVEERLLQH